MTQIQNQYELLTAVQFPFSDYSMMNRFPKERIQEMRDSFLQHANEMERIKVDSVRSILRNMGFNPTDYFLEMVTFKANNDEPYIEFEEFVGIIDQIEDDAKATKDGKDSAQNGFHYFLSKMSVNPIPPWLF